MQASAISDATRALSDARRNGLADRSDKKRTLTARYNEKSTWLRDAHRRLDSAVFQAYGWDPAVDDAQVLDEPLKLNLVRSTTPA